LARETNSGENVAWEKMKRLFVTSDESAAAGDSPDVDALLEKYEVPAGESGSALPAETSAASLSGTIDFQGLYDQAGIPNTDEVEALEKFLGGLDESLPQASKIAASKAFLGAIGKSPNDVIVDAGRKIAVVRAVEEAKRGDMDKAIAREQQIIDELQKQIEERRGAMQAGQGDLESVRGQCAVEEARLQGARVFFGALSANPPGPATGGAKKH
jgi:hypothetical protein